MWKTGIFGLLALAVTAPAMGEDVPSGRLARERVAVVDGDSITVDGREWRLMGFDTPETTKAWCEGEHRLGLMAKRRLAEMIAGAGRLEVIYSGRTDRYRRPLGDLVLDGRNVRDVMIGEGWARPYNGGRRKGWCSRDARDHLVPRLSERP